MKYHLRKSVKPVKKYDAVFEDGTYVSFGQRDYGQYRDNALGLYSHLDHLDLKRRENYKKRFAKLIPIKYSPAYFSNKYLWT